MRLLEDRLLRSRPSCASSPSDVAGHPLSVSHIQTRKSSCKAEMHMAGKRASSRDHLNLELQFCCVVLSHGVNKLGSFSIKWQSGQLGTTHRGCFPGERSGPPPAIAGARPLWCCLCIAVDLASEPAEAGEAALAGLGASKAHTAHG